MSKRSPAGFTLVELLVVVVLVAIMATIALPGLGRLAETNRAAALADLLHNHLVHARTRAVLTHRPVELCGSSNGEDCDDDWSRGWILRSVGSDTILSRHHLGGPLSLHRNRDTGSVRFRSNGTAPASNSRFYICDGKGEVLLQLVINNQGRTRRAPGLESGQGEGEYCGGDG